jgi:fumarate hydratase class II
MHIAAYSVLVQRTIPSLNRLHAVLRMKSESYKSIVKIGRTHWMDATPLTLGQEFSGYASQIEHGLKALENTLPHLLELAIGGTAVGTGINAPKGFAEKATKTIAELTGYPFINAPNKFEALASHDAMVETHGALKQVSISLMKIANDIRVMASGPRSGIAELILPANEPGSSIMPGKVNPTQIEALTMVCAQVIGNDSAITMGAMSGHFELNVFKPMIIHNFLQSANLLSDAVNSFIDKALEGLEPNTSNIERNLRNSLMLITALNPHIGYEKSAEIAKLAFGQNLSLKEAALQLGYVTENQFDEWVDPTKMIGD